MHQIRLLLILGSYLFGALQASGQEPSRNSSPAAKRPTGYVRVWNFMSSIKGEVAVSLVGGEPVILSRSLAAGRLAGYREVPPGQYRISIHAAAVDPRAKPSGQELLPSSVVTVTNGSFQTIILQDQVGPNKVSVANDRTTGAGIPPGGKRLRIFDFAPGQQVSLKTSNEVLAANISLGSSQHIFSTNPGLLNIVMSNKLPNGHEAEQPMDFDFNRCDSISAILMFDRYGRLTLEVAEDAKAE